MLASGIIEKYGSGQLRFWHLNFQEHFTARALLDRSDDEWWKIIAPQLYNPQWRRGLGDARSLAQSDKRRSQRLR